MIRDPSFRSVKTMIKAPPDYEGTSFRIKPTTPTASPTSPTSPATAIPNNVIGSSDKDPDMDRSTHQLYRSQDADGRRSPADSHSATVTTNDRFALLVQQHGSEEIAVLSKPQWSTTDMVNAAASESAGGGDYAELNMSGYDNDTISMRHNNSQKSPVRIMRLMSRKDLLQVDVDPQGDNQGGGGGGSEMNVNIPPRFSSPRYQSKMTPSSSSNSMLSPTRPPSYTPQSHHSPSPSYPPSSLSRHGLNLTLNVNTDERGDSFHQDTSP